MIDTATTTSRDEPNVGDQDRTQSPRPDALFDAAAHARDPAALTPAPPAEVAGVVASGVYAKGRRIADILIEEAHRYLERPGHVVWVGLLEPSDELLKRVQAQFGLHDHPPERRRYSTLS